MGRFVLARRLSLVFAIGHQNWLSEGLAAKGRAMKRLSDCGTSKRWLRIACCGLAMVTGLFVSRVHGQPVAKQSKILFLGNSHTAANDLPGLFSNIADAHGLQKTEAQSFHGGFLESFANHQRILNSIKSGQWDVLVLQGQKISMSGRYKYSTDAAKKLAKIAEDAGTRVVWFCEWARLDVEETERIENVYFEIVQTDNERLSAIGRVWESLLKENPELVLHASDGNHAVPQGSFVAAMTLYCSITNCDPLEIPYVDLVGIDREVQSLFRRHVHRHIHQPAVRLSAVEQVLIVHSDLAKQRDLGSKNASLESAISQYTNRSSEFDLKDCPKDFRTAIQNHIQVWKDSQSYFSQYSDLRGELHDLFAEIKSQNPESNAELLALEHRIQASKERVEKCLYAAKKDAGRK